MSYNAGEALILTIVKSCTNFDASNTSREDWKVLNTGKSNHYAILRPGAFSIERASLRSHDVLWQTVIEVWQRYGKDATTPQSLGSRRDEIIAAIQAKPKLGDTTGSVVLSGITGGSDPEEMWTKRGGPQWLRGEVYVEWTERTTVTFS